ncbi:hypothetical protein VP01_8g18 [Puccinia sorghi]|uniref:Uncharacterized protein n=1 Tax=Puccinia sorghi TaxID=27349 RepID=A0A0L6U7S7_9BASI|nr:hypothetical protein VP01_8g18 [Puccinia sorghi]
MITDFHLSELDNNFNAFREALTREPKQQEQLNHLKHQLIKSINNASQPFLLKLKLERKRSRQRLDNDSHNNPKAARSHASINSSAGLLSRRTSQVTIDTSPSTNPLAEFLSPPTTSQSTNYHHYQLTSESPLHPSCYSSIQETPLISPHDLSLTSSENSISTLLTHSTTNSLPTATETPTLTTPSELSNTGNSNSLHVQLSDIISDLSYQQQQLPDHENLTSNSTIDLDLPMARPSTLNSPEILDSNDHQLSLIPSDQQVDLHPCSMIAADPNDHKLPQTTYNFSSSSLIPVGRRIDLSSLPCSLPRLSSTSTLGLQSEPLQDEMMRDSMVTDQITMQPEPSLSSESMSLNSLSDRPPTTTRSRAGTTESQRPSTSFPTGDEDINSTMIEDTLMDMSSSNEPSAQIPLHSIAPPPASLSTSVMPPLTKANTLISSTTSSFPLHTTTDEHLPSLNPPRVPSPPVNRQMGAASAGVGHELAAQFDPIFTNWLGRLCSDLDMKDSKGEPIHQTLMARKMQRLEESADFRPFKFRIQAFTNSFFEELVRHGFHEKDLPMKKVRQYLWSQSCISRFNEEGKKANAMAYNVSRSKGNHVWHIEAKKMMNGQWSFLHFQRKIIGTPPPEAYSGIKWSWTAKVWDPQCSAQNIQATFSSPDLPAWLSWKGNLLTGVPTHDLIDGIRSTSYSQIPSLSRTDSSESVPISSPSLEDPPRPGQAAFEGILTDACLMHDLEVVLKQQDKSLEFDSAHAADVLNGMMSNTPPPTTTEDVVGVLGKLSDNNNSNVHQASVVPPKCQSIDISSSSNHPLALHLDHQPMGLGGTMGQPGNSMAGEGQMTGLSELGMMIPPNSSLRTLEADGLSSTATGMIVDVSTMQTDMMPDGMISPTQLIAHPVLKAPSAGEMRVRLSNGTNADLVAPPTSSCTVTVPSANLPSVAAARMIEEAVVQQQHAVALHQARLQSVRENLMSPDSFISDSAGNLIRTAIVSDDPFARQFAADVLAPMTSPSSSSVAPTTTTTTTTTTTPAAGSGTASNTSDIPTNKTVPDHPSSMAVPCTTPRLMTTSSHSTISFNPDLDPRRLPPP